jgi:hypothetical protein
MQEDCGCDGQPIKPKTTVLSKILNKVFVSDVEKDQRMALCRECSHFLPNLSQCGICLCFLEAKTRLVKFHCALDEIGEEPKW